MGELAVLACMAPPVGRSSPNARPRQGLDKYLMRHAELGAETLLEGEAGDSQGLGKECMVRE